MLKMNAVVCEKCSTPWELLDFSVLIACTSCGSRVPEQITTRTGGVCAACPPPGFRRKLATAALDKQNNRRGAILSQRRKAALTFDFAALERRFLERLQEA